MDPGKQSAAAEPSRPASAADVASIDVYLKAMSLGGPSSSRQEEELQQRYAMPTSPLLPSQVVGPAAGLHPLMQQHQMARMRLMQQQQPSQFYGGVQEASSSSGGGFLWPIGNDYVSPLASHGPSSDSIVPHLAANGRSSDYVSQLGSHNAYPFAAPAASRPSVPRMRLMQQQQPSQFYGGVEEASSSSGGGFLWPIGKECVSPLASHGPSSDSIVPHLAAKGRSSDYVSQLGSHNAYPFAAPAAPRPSVPRMRLMQQQQPSQFYGGVEEASSSSGGGFLWPIGNDCVSPLASHGPSSDSIVPHLATNGRSSDYVSQFVSDYAYPFAAPAAPRPSVPRKPSTLRASANQYQPIATASRYSVIASYSSSKYHPSASNYQPRAAFSEQDYQESLKMNMMRANQGEPSSLSPRHTHPIRRRERTLDEVRLELLRGPMPLGMVYFRESVAHVIRLLQEGVDEYRLSVLALVKSNAHKVMGDQEGHQVFIALLRACVGRRDELDVIVKAATTRSEEGLISRVAKQNNGVTCVKELIKAVAPYPEMCKLLIACLACERFLDDYLGEKLLPTIFAEMRYEDTSVLIGCVTYNFQRMLLTPHGSSCVQECFVNARGEELCALEGAILDQAAALAKGEYSNYFMQRVLSCGSEMLKRGVVERLMVDLVSVCQSQLGSFVVEACFLRTGSPDLLLVVLSTFLHLSDEDLANLVQCRYSNYTVTKLLSTGKDCLRVTLAVQHFPDETVRLAGRIEKLPEQVFEKMHTRRVMRVIREVLPQY
ncbi:hypothetical protein ABZP36_019832 [Zizania latifolia]